MTPDATLEFARTHGLDGVQFLEPSAIDTGLDSQRLAAFRRKADSMGLYLEVGMPSPNPFRSARELNRPVSATEHAASMIPHLEAVAALACRHARVYLGDRHDRFRSDTPWQAQVEASVEVMSLLTPRLLDLGAVPRDRNSCRPDGSRAAERARSPRPSCFRCHPGYRKPGDATR